MVKKQKIGTEASVREALLRGEPRFPPLEIVSFEAEVRRSVAGRAIDLDGILTVRWGERSHEFGVEIKRTGTPKAVEEAILRAREHCRGTRLLPLVVAPYLSPDRIAMIEAQGVSGLDLCGNGVVVVPGEMLVYRTGSPNRFPNKAAIKNVFRRNSSIVARAFLLTPRYRSVRDLLAEIRQRGGEVAIATVSKVCSAMVEEIVIERVRNETKGNEKQLRLLQPEKLLDLLVANYSPPIAGRSLVGKCTLADEELVRTLGAWSERSGNRVVETGASSANTYAVMAREPMRSFYCTDLEGVLESLGRELRETGRFANVEFLETTDEFGYFDRRDGLVASPIQTYLDLLSGDKRDRETADQVRRVILTPLADWTEGTRRSGRANDEPH